MKMRYPLLTKTEMVSKLFRGAICALALTAAGSPAIAGNKHKSIQLEEMAWQPLPNSPFQIVWLWGNPKSNDHAYFLKMPSGTSPGPHTHTGDYHAVNISGTWVHTFGESDEQTIMPGGYVLQPGKEVHNDVCAGPEPCILFVHQHAVFDFFPAK